MNADDKTEFVHFAHCVMCDTSLSGYGRTKGHAALDAIRRLRDEHSDEQCDRTREANRKGGLQN